LRESRVVRTPPAPYEPHCDDYERLDLPHLPAFLLQLRLELGVRLLLDIRLDRQPAVDRHAVRPQGGVKHRDGLVEMAAAN
jgi:hypothetical protein